MRSVINATAAPGVLRWYRVYCAAMSLLYLACLVGGALLLVYRHQVARWDKDLDATFWVVYGLVFLAIGGVLFAAFLASFFLPTRPWVWVYHLVLMGLGLTSPCCIPASLPLLIYWLKPETQAFFGRAPAVEPPSRNAR